LVRRSGVLRDAVAEGPVFLLYLHQTEKNVFAPKAEPVVQAVGDRLIEGFLDLDRSSLIQGELDDERICASLYVEIGRIESKVSFVCSVITWKRSPLGAFSVEIIAS
jgi:hypothetical protein